MPILKFEVCKKPLKFYFATHRNDIDKNTVKDENLCSIACFWSKTTLIPSSVSGAGVNPPFSKVSTFFLRSLALSVPIRRNFQSNGVKWRSFEP